MLSIINGGIYKVQFNGASNSEFNGLHPALIVKTLKEEELYFVVPLTSYTKDKMQQIKKNGAGIHLKSMNSIARIDKLQIMHNRNLKGRWRGDDGIVKIDLAELAEVNRKVSEYTKLSFDKAEKEYSKYRNQYESIHNALTEVFETKLSNDVFSLKIISEKFIIECAKTAISNISMSDISQIANDICGSGNINVAIENNNLVIRQK